MQQDEPRLHKKASVHNGTRGLHLHGKDTIDPPVSDGGSDLLSPKRRLEPLSEDGSSDVDVLDLSPGTRLVKRPSQKKKRRKKTKNVEAMDGGSDLLSPKKRLEPLSGDGSSDGDVLDLSPGTRLVKRPSEKKKRREKTVEEMVVDLSPGTRLMKRPSQKKKRRNKTKNVEAMVPPTVKVKVKDRGGKQRGVKVKRPWKEAERSAVNKHMEKFIAERRLPGKEHCMRCIKRRKPWVKGPGRM
ncbi:uncharacterized protein LOC116684820 isoform X2 [Etheostoma spectabile]|uniref:uncharacterized protein LOC116684820 isoform X2 n=1 Tax=Etheostoma spectabile TaxID=54343 RepID=UPI0013AF997C|nr:uncharacterized protein LOC116684820 isoform X2 [Etheostoma spectabile]